MCPFRARQNNPISLMGGLGLGSQALTATFGIRALEQEMSLPKIKKGRYAWITGKRLGKGAYGEVVEMFNSTTWTRCAGKKMEQTHFQHETSLLQSLDHPHIARYIDQEIRPGVSCHLVMELCPLKDLGKQHKERPLSEDEVVEMFAQATSALKYLHEQGVTHRDIKPGNILVRSRKPDPFNIALSDFGLATKNQELMSTFGCGTYPFMAPEVVAEHIKNRGKVDVKYDNKADIWSMGLVVLDLLLPGGLPLPATYGIAINADEPDQRYAHKMLRIGQKFLEGRRGQPFAQLVADMIQWDPAKRPSAKECAERAASVLAGPRLLDTEGHILDQPDTSLLNRSPRDEEATQTIKRKHRDSSSEETIREPSKKLRQDATAQTRVSKLFTGSSNASNRRAARSQAPSASTAPKTPNTRSLERELEREQANSVNKGHSSGPAMAEPDCERLESSDSARLSGPGDGYVLEGSGPRGKHHDPSPSTKISAALPDVEASTTNSLRENSSW
ncbi:hypothetical protein N0V82_009549 [Gnomoniopsis sp. IMI 355080]|nr:hypothetical protein N0V82_009549 [Gnomoniopsis sp. IMI 355080]